MTNNEPHDPNELDKEAVPAATLALLGEFWNAANWDSLHEKIEKEIGFELPLPEINQ